MRPRFRDRHGRMGSWHSPTSRLLADRYARRLNIESLEERRLLTLSEPALLGTADWFEQGPAPIEKGGSLTGLGPTLGTAAGAVTGIAVNPRHPEEVYISTVGGGVWWTDNITRVLADGITNQPDWQHMTDDMPSLQTTCITFGSPAPGGEYTTLYAGTGW